MLKFSSVIQRYGKYWCCEPYNINHLRGFNIWISCKFSYNIVLVLSSTKIIISILKRMLYTRCIKCLIINLFKTWLKQKTILWSFKNHSRRGIETFNLLILTQNLKFTQRVNNLFSDSFLSLKLYFCADHMWFIKHETF